MAPRYIADAMLGRLARWLRALGHDVRFDPSIDDPELARLALGEERALLTRDRPLCRDRGDPEWCLILECEKPRDQLLELHGRGEPVFGSGWRERLFTRCMVCNTPLAPLEPDRALHLLPPAVGSDATTRASARGCPGCGRLYWEGGHTRRMRAWLERVAETL